MNILKILGLLQLNLDALLFRSMIFHCYKQHTTVEEKRKEAEEKIYNYMMKCFQI